MDDTVFSRLQCLNYDGPLKEKSRFSQCITGDTMSNDFIELVKWIGDQLKCHMSIQETISDSRETFLIDLKGVLRELECPYHEVMNTSSFNGKCKLFILDFLLSELQTFYMYSNIESGKTDDENQPMEAESNNTIASTLKLLFNLLKITSSFNTTDSVFSTLQHQLSDKLSTLAKDILSEPLLERTLDSKQWSIVSSINDTMSEEYSMRQQVLVKRIDVTIQSFSWSDKLKDKQDVVSSSYLPLRRKFTTSSLTSTLDILVARKDLCIFGKTSGGVAREMTKCDINKTLIGKVPDRGGRPSLTAPPAEMPKFQQRRTDSANSRRGGGSYRGNNRRTNTVDSRGRGDHRGGRGGGYGQGGYGQGRQQERGWNSGASCNVTTPKQEEKVYYS